MSEQIKVGDLVVVVRGHSCVLELIGGVPFTVVGIVPQRGGGWTCNHCGQRDIAPEAGYAAEGAPRPNVKLLKLPNVRPSSIPLPWLKRIPPLSELEDEKRKEELTA